LNSTKKIYHNSTVTNTNNNSISSLKPNNAKYTFNGKVKNNFFNQKLKSFIPKSTLSKHTYTQKMKLYKKKIYTKKNISSFIPQFPLDLLSKKNKDNINTKKINKNKNNNNIILKNKNININKSQNLNINNSKIIKTKKNNTKINNYINNSSFCVNNNNNKQNINPNSINTNTYIINTLNVSEKNYLKSEIQSTTNKNFMQGNDLEIELNNIIKENEGLNETIKKQQKLIERLKDENDKLGERIVYTTNENKKIHKKIEIHQENQEQLIMLIKIIQKNGVDVEKLIDKWNEEAEVENNEDDSNEQNEYEYEEKEDSLSDSVNELNSKIDPSSFIPINLEEPQTKKKIPKGIPKLNLEILKSEEVSHKKG